jgi:hypothetical protein
MTYSYTVSNGWSDFVTADSLTEAKELVIARHGTCSMPCSPELTAKIGHTVDSYAEELWIKFQPLTPSERSAESRCDDAGGAK